MSSPDEHVTGLYFSGKTPRKSVVSNPRPVDGSRVGQATDGSALLRIVVEPSGLPYAAALSGGFVSTALTHLYVGAGASELNPVMRALIAAVGLDAMVVVKTTVLVVGYWGYCWLRGLTRSSLVTGFAWASSMLYVADAVHNIRVVLAAPVLVPVEHAEAVLFATAVLAGLVFWPRWRFVLLVSRAANTLYSRS